MSTPSKPLIAAVWMTGAIVSFTSMAIAGRAVSSELDTFELMMYRSFIGVVILTVLGGVTGFLRQVRFDRLGLHLLRNLSHFTGQNLWFSALSMVTLSQVFALEFTTPIWVVILATIVLGEQLTRYRVIAVFLGFIGAMIVARPGAGGDPVGLMVAAGSAVGFAGSIVVTKLLTRTETIFGILFWLTVMQLVMGLVTSGWDGDVHWPSSEVWPWVALVAIAGLVAHTCLTNALRVAPASVVTPMDFLRLPAIIVIGALFYGEPISIWVLLGALFIFAGIYLNILSEARRGT